MGDAAPVLSDRMLPSQAPLSRSLSDRVLPSQAPLSRSRQPHVLQPHLLLPRVSLHHQSPPFRALQPSAAQQEAAYHRMAALLAAAGWPQARPPGVCALGTVVAGSYGSPPDPQTTPPPRTPPRHLSESSLTHFSGNLGTLGTFGTYQVCLLKWPKCSVGRSARGHSRPS